MAYNQNSFSRPTLMEEPDDPPSVKASFCSFVIFFSLVPLALQEPKKASDFSRRWVVDRQAQ
jgi:hypothetical protein